MNSLLLVFFLGLCMKPDWNRLREQVVRYTGYIWIDFDERREKRCLSYRDWETTYYVDLDRGYRKGFYEKLSRRMLEARKKKREAFGLIITCLEWVPSDSRSLWKTCRDMQERLCQRFHLVTFWPN